jgi:hypothetical protein
MSRPSALAALRLFHVATVPMGAPSDLAAMAQANVAPIP